MKKESTGRVIKFRAWDDTRKEMNEPVEVTFRDDGAVEVAPCYLDSTYIPLQFTGLHDKNGQEIYDGDIVSIHPALVEDEPRYSGKRYVVEYHAPNWMLTSPVGSWSNVSGGGQWWRHQTKSSATSTRTRSC